MNLEKSESILEMLFLHMLHMLRLKKQALIATEISRQNVAGDGNGTQNNASHNFFKNGCEIKKQADLSAKKTLR